MRLVVRFFLIWSLAVLVMRGYVFAAGNLHIGSLEIGFIESFLQEYNDNIYLEPKGQENSDQVTKAQFGISLKKPVRVGRDFNFKADYAADIFLYNHNDKENRTDHTASFIGDFPFAGNFYLVLNEHFKKTADPPNSELTDLEKRIRNMNNVALGYRNQHFQFEVGSFYIRDNYHTFDTLDKKEYISSQLFYWYFSPKTSVFIEHNFGKIRYDENITNNNSEYDRYNIGLKGMLGSKLAGVIKAGYKENDYQNNRGTSAEDYKGSVWFGSVMYRMKERSLLSLYGQRDSVESSFLTNNYFVNSVYGGTIEHLLTKRIQLNAGLSEERNTYPEDISDGGRTAEREDTAVSFRAGIRYEFFEWLFLKAGYEYRDKNSNFTAYEYNNNIYSGRLSLVF